MLEEAESVELESEKTEKIRLAESKKLDAAKLINETVGALAIAKTLDNEIIERESDVLAVKSLQANIKKAIDDGNRTEAEANMKKLDEIAAATYQRICT